MAHKTITRNQYVKFTPYQCVDCEFTSRFVTDVAQHWYETHSDKRPAPRFGSLREEGPFTAEYIVEIPNEETALLIEIALFGVNHSRPRAIREWRGPGTYVVHGWWDNREETIHHSIQPIREWMRDLDTEISAIVRDYESFDETANSANQGRI